MDELSRRTLQYTENPTAFSDEKDFNFYSSLIKPHCAICSILSSFELEKEINQEYVKNWRLPLSSLVSIPRSIFLSRIKNVTSLNEIQSQSLLYVCSNCKICVHSGNWNKVQFFNIIILFLNFSLLRRKYFD